MDLVVGNKYKVNCSNASGWYEIREIRENRLGQQEIICKGSEPFLRTFSPEQFIKEDRKVSQAKRIVTAGTTVIDTWGEVSLNIEEVTYWPTWGSRGRPRKAQ